MIAELFWEATFQRKYAILTKNDSQMGAELAPKWALADRPNSLFLPLGRQGCASGAKSAKKVPKVTPRTPKPQK